MTKAPTAATSTTPTKSSALTPMDWRELLMFVLVLIACICVLPLIGGAILWTRPFWLDERCCTLYNISETSSPIQIIKNVARGDFAPPMLHLIYWTATRIVGFSTPAVRSIALVSVCLALVFLYATLRRRFGREPSAIAIVALATHELVLDHAFEIRFYGPWLTFAAGYAWSLGLDADRARSRRRDAAVAVFSILICTIHWFGVISLGIMAVAAIASRGRRWREGVRLVAPSVAGLVALAACLPLLFTQFRTGGQSIYWIPPLSLQQVSNLALILVVRTAPILAVVLLLRDRLLTVHRASLRTILFDQSLAALAALMLMPVALIVMSAVLKPVVWPRYAIVALLAWTPLVALAVETLGRVGRIAVMALFLALLYFAEQGVEARVRQYATDIGDYATQMEVAKRHNIPIVFQSYFLMYPVDGGSRRQSQARFLELTDSTIASLGMTYPWVRRALVRDRNMVRTHEATFGFPIRITQAQLDTTRRFYLMAVDGSLPGGYQNSVYFGSAVFRRHKAVRLNDVVTLFERTR